VTVLAETAEFAAEIDLARAEAALVRAQKRLASGDTNLDWDRAIVSLQRALIRIQVARKYRGAPSARTDTVHDTRRKSARPEHPGLI